MPGPDYKPQPPDPSGSLNQFCASPDPFPPGHLGDYMVQVRAERDLYRDALNDLFQSIDQAAHAKAIQWDRHSPTMNAARKALGL